jgi:hypothetical protein
MGHFTIHFRVLFDGKFSSRTTKMRQIDIFRKVIRHMLNSTVFPKPYTRTHAHTQELVSGVRRRLPVLLMIDIGEYRNLCRSEHPFG